MSYRRWEVFRTIGCGFCGALIGQTCRGRRRKRRSPHLWRVDDFRIATCWHDWERRFSGWRCQHCNAFRAERPIMDVELP